MLRTIVPNRMPNARFSEWRQTNGRHVNETIHMSPALAAPLKALLGNDPLSALLVVH
jgi:hypothetical protein